MGWFSRGPAVDPFGERAGGDDVLFHAAGVRIRASATDLRIPGHNRVSKAVRLHRGSVLVTTDHLAIAYKKYIAVDGRVHLDPAASAQVSYDAVGVHLVIDLTGALQGVPGKNSGTAMIDIVAPIPPEVLGRLSPGAVTISAVQVSAIARRI